MKINWHIRLRNKCFLLTFIPLIISFVYQVLALFDIMPGVSQDTVVKGITVAINGLAALGVIIDPTTKGICDSSKALQYQEFEEEENGA